MNRPFGALAALSAMLALSMLAVSSSSRSTTVGPGPAIRPRGGRTHSRVSYLAATPPHCDRQAIKSATNSAASIAADPPACDQAAACDEHTEPECIGIVADDSPATNTNRWSCEKAAIRSTTACCNKSAELATPAGPGGPQPTQLEAAEPVAALPAAAERVDCRAGYDPAYDELIYGAQGVTERSRSAVRAAGDASELDSVEVIELFRSIFRRSGPETNASACQRTSSLRGPALTAASPVSWTEYGKLIDAAVARADSSLQSSTADLLDADVRSGRGLLHSAASAVNDLGQLLQRVTDAFSEGSATAPLAKATAAGR